MHRIAPAIDSSTSWRQLWQRWEPYWRVIAMLAVLAVVGAKWWSVIRAPKGDFPRHVEFGRRFLDQENIYASGLNIPYPPLWAMVHAPLSMMHWRLPQPTVFILGPLSFVAILFCVQTFSRRTGRESNVVFWASMLTFLICSRYIARDLDESGPNLTLVALSWLGIWLWSRQQDLAGAASLGLAIALKCTAAIFVLYFAWKREWRMAVYSMLIAGLFTLAPILYQGPGLFAEEMKTWAKSILNASKISNPTQGILGDEPVANKSLRPAIGRFLVRLPEGHLARFDHPGYVDFLNLTPAWAGKIVQGITLLGLAAFAWSIRGRIRNRQDSRYAWECAAVGVLALLLSPITWGQHCVATIPAVFLFLRSLLSGDPLSRGMIAGGSVYAIIVLVLNRSVFGKDLSLVLESYHLVTWSLVLLLVMVTLRSRRVELAQAPSEAHEPVKLAA